MSDERRFNEQEIAAIFKQATEAQEAAHRHLAHSEGLTLAELQHIGQEAGITPAFIARAATAVGQRAPPPPPPTFLGLPVGVTRSIELPGPFTEADWDRLVVDLRDTFLATGKVQRTGSLRQWSNGNLHALVEPTETGHRLRFSTRKGNAAPALLNGLGALAMGLVILLMLALAGEFSEDLEGFVMAALFGLVGLGILGLTAYRLPRWVKERGEQMEAIAARTAQRAAARQDGALHETDPPQLLEEGASLAEADVESVRRARQVRS